MKKNIVIIILGILIVAVGITSTVNRVEAAKQRELAEVYMIEAEKQREIALMYADSAAVARERADVQRMHAESIMQKLKEAYTKLEACK